MSESDYSTREREFEEYLRDGISAAKSGERSLARTLLTRAMVMNSADARTYLWLSTTTEDPKELREYLEQAVARDPNNVAARRELAILTGKIDKASLIPEGIELKTDSPAGPVAAQGQAFQCPRCGGRTSFSLQTGQLTCDYCGYQQSAVLEAVSGKVAGPVADRAEQVLDFVIPTARGHRWAEAQQSLSCERCGAVSVLPPGSKTVQCPYCGSNQMVTSPELGELVDPQVIALMKLDEKKSVQQARQWLGRGFFAPDNLLRASRGLQLRPAYYSFWTFDGSVEVHWSCEVVHSNGNAKQWVPSSGVEAQFFDDVLVPGVKALDRLDIPSVEPFNLLDVEEFKPEFLAGWPAILYDRSLSDASLLARERVMKRLRAQLPSVIEMGHEKRNLTIGGGNWSAMTFKHILLPLWIGSYSFQNKVYHVLVNGQTGKVGGDKPRDAVKLVFTTTTAVLFIFLLLLLYWLWSTTGRIF